MATERTEVLIVGGSLVGLSAAVFLAAQGVRSMLVERHAGTAIHPRAMGLSPRSMELFDTVGVGTALRTADPIQVVNTGILQVESLTGHQVGWLDTPRPADVSAISPAGWLFCAQDRIEPVLREHAADGADLRFGREMVSFEQLSDGVAARIRDRPTGTEHVVHADYLIAADGYRGSIRAALNIDVMGPGVLGSAMSVLFHADLRQYLRGRYFAVCYVMNPDVTGVLAAYDHDRWAFGVTYRPDQGESPDDFPDDRCRSLVRSAVGDPDLDPEILAVAPWSVAGQVARRYREGRVFLVGDCAHVTPPTGAFGANTGIQDAHNLAWKLAAVLCGRAAEPLLDSYDAERQPIGRLTVEQALLRNDFRTAGQPPDSLVDDLAVMLGYRYRTGALCLGHAGYQDAPDMADPARWTGQPGTRAAHLPIERSGDKMSILELFGTGFVCVAGRDGQRWVQAARRSAGASAGWLAVHQVGVDFDDPDDRWPTAYGVGPSGAVIVRPDGFIGWRSSDILADVDPARVDAVLAVLLGHPEQSTGGRS